MNTLERAKRASGLSYDKLAAKIDPVGKLKGSLFRKHCQGLSVPRLKYLRLYKKWFGIEI